MNALTKTEALEVGYNVPASVGMDEADIQTPCLIIDFYAFEKNVAAMRDFCKEMGVRDGKVECLWPVTARDMAF